MDRIKRIRKKSAEIFSADLPLVVVSRIANTLQLTAVDPRALADGLYPGLPLADARARVPTLDVVEADTVSDLKLLETIADWCERFTPLVAIDGKQGLLLDITGCAHLFNGEAAMMQALCTFLRSRGISIGAAIAGTAVAANILARGVDGAIVINGEEHFATASLPVSLLPVESKALQVLIRAGLKTIGALSERNSSELTARFGTAFTFILEQALGRNGQPITPRRPLPDYVAERRFAEPITTSEAISDALASLANTLEALLEERGQGARRLEASFFRADGAVRHIELMIGRPLRNADSVTEYFSERLEALTDPVDPGFGFDLIRLAVLHAEILEHQTVGFGPDCNEEDIDTLVERLSARFGADRVTHFQSRNTHVPEFAAISCPAQGGRFSGRWPQIRGEGEAPRRPLHMLSPPEFIDKVMALVPDGPPSQFVWRHAFHKVVRVEGPERIAMEWWRDTEARTRDYFQVEDEGGRRFWLYRDGLYNRETDNPKWFVHGLFA